MERATLTVSKGMLVLAFYAVNAGEGEEAFSGSYTVAMRETLEATLEEVYAFVNEACWDEAYTPEVRERARLLVWEALNR